MKVKLARRWGPHRASDKPVEVSDSQGEWLIRNGYAEPVGDVSAPEKADAPVSSGRTSADPAEDGADNAKRPARRRSKSGS